MSAMILWAYCDKCDRMIHVGETCYNVGEYVFCRDCCTEVDTQERYDAGWKDES